MPDKNESPVPKNSSPKKGSSIKIILIVVGVLILLGAIGAGVWYFFLREETPESETDNQDTQSEEGQDNGAINNNLVTIPGLVRECYEEAIGMPEFGELQSNKRAPTAEEQAKIDKCNEDLGYVGEEETTGPSGGQETTGPQNVTICEQSDDWEYTYIGKIITQENTGINSGVIADSSALLLNDGKVRVYFGWTDGIKSATSTQPLESPYTDAEYKLDSGTRVSGRYGHPRVVFTGGKYWMFVRLDDKIFLYSSTNGLAFTEEKLVLSASDLGFKVISGVGIAKLGNTWRMYISNVLSDTEMTQPEGRPDLYVKSLRSSSISGTWKADNGVRLGRDSGVSGFEEDDQGKVGQAEHPSAVVTSDGDMFVAFRGTNTVCFSKSEDGLEFDQPILISDETTSGDEFAGGDPDIIELEPGVYLVTGTSGGNSLAGHIRMGILREK